MIFDAGSVLLTCTPCRGVAAGEPILVGKSWDTPYLRATLGVMIWFFERGSEFLRIETSYDRIVGLYALRAQMPDGTQQVETFANSDACQKRLEAMDSQLRADHWRLRQARPLRSGTAQ